MVEAMGTMNAGGRGAFWGVYVAAWVGCAVAAAGYLGLSLARPELIAQWTSHSHQTTSSTTGALQTSSARDRAGSDQLGELRGEVDTLRSDVAEIRTKVANQQPTIDRIAEAVETLRRGGQDRVAAVGQSEVSTASAPAAQTAARESEPEPAPPLDVRGSTGRFPPLPTRAPAQARSIADAVTAPAIKQPGRLAALPGQPRVLNGSAGEPAPEAGVTTGSLPLRPSRGDVVEPPPAPQITEPSTPVVRFGAPVVTAAAPPPSGSGLAVRLSSGASLASLRVSWQVLRQLHGEDLGDLEGRYRIQGSTYQLLAGPFADRQQADYACSRLRTKNVPCMIDNFGGNAL